MRNNVWKTFKWDCPEVWVLYSHYYAACSWLAFCFLNYIFLSSCLTVCVLPQPATHARDVFFCVCVWCEPRNAFHWSCTLFLSEWYSSMYSIYGLYQCVFFKQPLPPRLMHSYIIVKFFNWFLLSVVFHPKMTWLLFRIRFIAK